MKRRWIYRDGEAIEVSQDYVPEPRGPLVFGDLPSYRSPVTGLWVDGRVQRREDLKRTGSRPYEGRDQEQKEAARQAQYAEQRLEQSIEHSARVAFHQLPPEKRRILEGR